MTYYIIYFDDFYGEAIYPEDVFEYLVSCGVNTEEAEEALRWCESAPVGDYYMGSTFDIEFDYEAACP